MKEKMDLSDLWGGCIWSSSKPQTNYDRLVSKTPEELAVFMHDMFLISTEIGLSTDWWLQWLKSPVEEKE